MLRNATILCSIINIKYANILQMTTMTLLEFLNTIIHQSVITETER